eukprot:g68474.t1
MHHDQQDGLLKNDTPPFEWLLIDAVWNTHPYAPLLLGPCARDSSTINLQLADDDFLVHYELGWQSYAGHPKGIPQVPYPDVELCSDFIKLGFLESYPSYEKLLSGIILCSEAPHAVGICVGLADSSLAMGFASSCSLPLLPWGVFLRVPSPSFPGCFRETTEK